MVPHRSTVLHALEKSKGDVNAASLMLLNLAASPHAPKGYYANVMTGATSLVSPVTEVAAPVDHKALSDVPTEEIAKSVRKMGSAYKTFAEQIIRYFYM